MSLALRCGLDVPLQTGGSVLPLGALFAGSEELRFGFENGEEKFKGLRRLLSLDDEEDLRGGQVR